MSDRLKSPDLPTDHEIQNMQAEECWKLLREWQAMAARCITVCAKLVARLDSLGCTLTIGQIPYLELYRKVARGDLTPAAVERFRDRPEIIKRLHNFPQGEMDRLAREETSVDFVGDDGKPTKISPREIKSNTHASRLIDIGDGTPGSGRLRTIAEQACRVKEDREIRKQAEAEQSTILCPCCGKDITAFVAKQKAGR